MLSDIEELYFREEPICALDPLLFIPRIEYLPAILQSLRARAAAYSLVILDMRNFHAINDLCDYEVGDRVLAAFMGLARARLPRGSVALRFRHGDEFLFFVPLDAGSAARLFGRIKQASERHRYLEGTAGADFVVSFSHAIVPMAGWGAADHRGLLALAEQRLRTAKRQPSARAFP